MGASSKVVEVLRHPEELIPLLRLRSKAKALPHIARASPEHWRYCFEHLPLVSRSFAMVIMELDSDLREAVCVFYLVLRALDTIEDDTSVPAKQRTVDCSDFYKHVDEAGWSTDAYGKGHEKNLLEQYGHVVRCFGELREGYQRVIRNIARTMGAGMAEHIEDTECVTLKDYNTYCYYVAGLVGVGLSQLFYESGREERFFVEREDLSISMGQFLQKINIIRDFFEDLEEQRTYWPREIWSKHVSRLSDLKESKMEPRALACLNQMVADALSHVPDCILYMQRLRHENVFNFCAIPQVMAIATLAELYSNPKVFHGVVKLRRGTTARLIAQTSDFPRLMQLYYRCCLKIESSLVESDACYELTRDRLHDIMNLCIPYIPTVPDLTVLNRTAVIMFAGLVAYLVHQHSDGDSMFVTWKGGVPDVREMIAVAALFLVMTYLLSFFGLQFVRAEVRPPQT